MFWLDRIHDTGDVDDGWRKRRRLCVDDRVLWREHGWRGTVIAVMPSNAVDAGDIWIRWDGHARPFVHKVYAHDFEVLSR